MRLTKISNIYLNGGGDLCQPTLEGVQLLHTNYPTLNVPIYNTILF